MAIMRTGSPERNGFRGISSLSASLRVRYSTVRCPLLRRHFDTPFTGKQKKLLDAKQGDKPIMTTHTTHRTAATADERKAQAEALHASIAEQVEKLRNSEQWERFLTFARSFHHYSFGNMLLILSQHPTATKVCGFRQWQSKERQVQRGQKGIRIIGYSQKKIIETDDENEETEHRVPRFPILSVFDIDQTDLMEGCTDDSTPARRLTGTDDLGIVDAVTSHLVSIGWTLERRAIGGVMNGYADPESHTVMIAEGVSPEQASKTAIHELAHILAGHTADLQEYSAHRGLMETEAESIAYVVAGVCGLDTSQYSIGYIANWSDGDTAMIKNTAEHVLSTSRTIIDLLTPEQELKVAAERPADAEYVVPTDPMDELQCDSCQ
jgi:antirestriction protein ArdC